MVPGSLNARILFSILLKESPDECSLTADELPGETIPSKQPELKPRFDAYYYLSSPAPACSHAADGLQRITKMMERPWTPANQRQIWYVMVILALMAFFVASCNQIEPQTKQAPKGPAAVRIEVTTIQRISVQRQVELAGTLISPDQAKVSSEVAGKVQELLVELGHEVTLGQPIVKLDPRELELSLRQAEGQLHQTEAQLGMDGSLMSSPPPDEEISTIRTAIANRDDARAQATRAAQLIQKGLIAQADYDTAQTRVKVTEAAYQSAMETVRSLKATLQQRRAAHELAQKKLSDAVIRAPIAGSISERLVQPGEFIRENTPVVTIVQMNPLKLKTAVQEKYASMVRVGQTAQFGVESVPDEIFPGRLAYISPTVDQATRTFPAEILVDNSARKLKPGFFAKGLILIRKDENVLAVPESAISTLAGESSVYVVTKNRVKKVLVTLGARVADNFEVIGGNFTGDEVLASTNLSELADNVGVAIGKGGGSPSGQGRPERPEGKARGGRQK
jgi:RND family efflux transporter MFP subunit